MVNYVYLMGHGFSGSTLLTFLLGSHPGVATVGEMEIAPNSKVAPQDFLCSCRQLIRECAFWRQVSAEMRQRGHDFDITRSDLLFRVNGSRAFAHRLITADLRPAPFELVRRAALRLVPSARRELAQGLRRNEAFAEVVTAMRGCGTFLDSSKLPERAVILRRAERIDVRVLHLVRDGRAVAYSCMKNQGMTAEQGARSWLRTAAACDRARGYFPADRWLTVRHEDLCSDVQATLDRVFEFMRVPPAPIGDFRSGDHHIIGNRMRLASTSEIRRDDRWREALTGVDRQRVEELLRDANTRYGYAAG